MNDLNDIAHVFGLVSLPILTLLGWRCFGPRWLAWAYGGELSLSVRIADLSERVAQLEAAAGSSNDDAES